MGRNVAPRNGRVLLFGLLFIWFISQFSVAQDFQITTATLDESNRPHLEFPGDASRYIAAHK